MHVVDYVAIGFLVASMLAAGADVVLAQGYSR